ncbi:MAG: hypothetical protein MZV63_03825 [Marinilabiliales bacterium]|nr:hypothetical protein [Marinilabiliales bacterium]
MELIIKEKELRKVLFLVGYLKPSSNEKVILLLLLLATLLICLNRMQALAAGENPLPWLGYLNDRRADSLLNTLTVREMIAQIIWVLGTGGKQKRDNYTEVEELVKKYGIGGVIFFEGELDRQRCCRFRL